MVDTGLFVSGVAITLAAGLLNGSWNTCVKDNAPSLFKTLNDGWTYDIAWCTMMMSAIPVNIILCFAFISPATLGEIISSSTTSDVVLICVFSFLWGLGTYGFGISVQIAGLGMGTTLTMGVIVVVGTFLPLLLDIESKLNTASGYTIIGEKEQELKQRLYINPTLFVLASLIAGGLFVCSLSFLSAAKALTLKDADEAFVTPPPTPPTIDDPEDPTEDPTVDPTSEIELTLPKPKFPNAISRNSTASPEYSTFTKVTVCVISGILCTMLQFSFVFSKDMRDIAETKYSVPAALSSAVTFFFAITICPIPNILIPLYKIVKAGDISLIYNSPSSTSNYLKTLFFMAVVWVVQSHLYGISAASLLGPEYGPAVGWPLLIVTTNVTGLVIGWKLLGEWDMAKERTIKFIKISLILSVIGLGIVSIGGLI